MRISSDRRDCLSRQVEWLSREFDDPPGEGVLLACRPIVFGDDGDDRVDNGRECLLYRFRKAVADLQGGRDDAHDEDGR